MKFTNRLIALLLCVVMMSAVACLSVSAITLFPVGDWVYHKINNDTEFEIYEYKGTSTSVFTPYTHNLTPITTVGSDSFSGNETLETITLSKYITTVNDHAFLNCTSLTSVGFQDVTVTAIDDSAFSGCSSLTSIALENTLIETVSYGTFMNCSSLNEVTLPETVTSIEENAFAYCDNLSKIVIPESVTAMQANVFTGSENVVIYCYEDSLAHRYAVNNSIEFVLMDSTPVETYMLGDVDNDGEIAIVDVTEIQLIIAQIKADEDGKASIRGDIDKDDVLSIMDAANIQRAIASYDDGYDIGSIFEY